ncbi:glutaredoxin [Dichotomocladium elegans]|nr:glutaredoxin [Dichotomocladium elegans]
MPAALTQDIQKLAEQLIAENKVMVFAKSYCPHCKNTKRVLDELHVSYYTIDLDLRPDGADIQAALLHLTGQRTVPNIFVNHQHIGGNTDLVAALESGKLEVLFKEGNISYSKL